MLQNQKNQRITQIQTGSKRNGRLTIQYGHRQGAWPQYPSSPEDEEDTQDSENKAAYHNIVGQPDFRNLTHEQRRRVADLHEHPYECENSPWRRQQPAITGEVSKTYTNRY